MPAKTNPLNILLIEDNEHDRVAFRRAMKMGDVDCRIAFCERAEEADELLKSDYDALDLVVLDFDLPGMNGLDFFKKIKRKKNLPPFVMLTGAGSEKLVVQSLQAGMYDFIVKDAQMGYLNLLPVVLHTVLRRYDDDRARREAKEALGNAKNELEQKVRERTTELAMTIRALENEIEEHRETEAELRRSQNQLRKLSRTILDSQENERKLVAQEIHDSIIGSLAAIKFALEEKLDSMGQNPSPDVISLEKVVSQVNATIKECRRVSAHLRPSLLDELGLLPTLNWHCREFENLHPGLHIEQQLDAAEDDIPEKLKVVIYRVLQEAMNNIVKHSGATRVSLLLEKQDQRIEFTVADNGRGFDPEKKFAESTITGGFGISGMRDRTLLCDGKFELTSEKGKGTKVHISLPSD